MSCMVLSVLFLGCLYDVIVFGFCCVCGGGILDAKNKGTSDMFTIALRFIVKYPCQRVAPLKPTSKKASATRR